MAGRVSWYLAVLCWCLIRAVSAWGKILEDLKKCGHCPAGCLGPKVRPATFQDYYYAKEGFQIYLKNNKRLLQECGTNNWDLYARATIVIMRVCNLMIPALESKLYTVRVSFPCYGNPTTAESGALVYPNYGRWTLLNLYLEVVVDSSGKLRLQEAKKF